MNQAAVKNESVIKRNCMEAVKYKDKQRLTFEKYMHNGIESFSMQKQKAKLKGQKRGFVQSILVRAKSVFVKPMKV